MSEKTSAKVQNIDIYDQALLALPCNAQCRRNLTDGHLFEDALGCLTIGRRAGLLRLALLRDITRADDGKASGLERAGFACGNHQTARDGRSSNVTIGLADCLANAVRSRHQLGIGARRLG